MSIKSIVELLAQADTTLPDNTTQEITPADVRQIVKDILDTLSPAYGAMTLASQVLALSATPAIIAPFATSLAAQAGYYVNGLPGGTVTRQVAAAGVAGATDFFIASGAVSGGNNNSVVIEIFKNGVATGYKTSVTCTGAGDNQGFNIAGLSYTAAPSDAVYTLRATGPAGSYTFVDVTMLVQAQPVRSFV
jgi:hypothetical protein